jgi:hypothetical protein
MAGLLLSDTERIRFVEWLEFQAENEKGMLKQLEKLDSFAPMIDHMKNRTMAYLIVAADLRNTEVITLEET